MNELSPPEGNRGYWRTTADTSGYRFADMRLGAVQQLGDVSEGKQVKIAEPLHHAPLAGDSFHEPTQAYSCGGEERIMAVDSLPQLFPIGLRKFCNHSPKSGVAAVPEPGLP